MLKNKKFFPVFTAALFLLCIFSVKVAHTCDSRSLKILKTGPKCVVPGGIIEYKVCIWSEEPDDVNNVYVADKIPIHTSLVDAPCLTCEPTPEDPCIQCEILSACEPDLGGYVPCIQWFFPTVPPETIICETFSVEVDNNDELIEKEIEIINRACGFAEYCSTEEECSEVKTTVEESCDGGIGCRVTGGGNDTAGMAEDGVNWDGTYAYKKKSPNKGFSSYDINGDGNGEENSYTFGGQAGANTGQQQQPKGEWTHHQKSGPAGSFVFHAGTASAPEGTEIDFIECSDPGFCNPARPAPAKQIDFGGFGTFKNVKANGLKSQVVEDETLHWFTVHIEDLGEPGRSGQHEEPDPAECPPGGTSGIEDNCGCPDFYHITIYPASPNLNDPVMDNPIYEVMGYIDGGNLQIHPPTGYDQN